LGGGPTRYDILPSSSKYFNKKKFYYICIELKKGYDMHSKNLNKKDFINGLYVEGGRLINDRSDSMTGIQKAASIKRSVSNDRKINQISEAIGLAESKKKFGQIEF